jgi:hypothetical protein
LDPPAQGPGPAGQNKQSAACNTDLKSCDSPRLLTTSRPDATIVPTAAVRQEFIYINNLKDHRLIVAAEL